MKFQFLHIEKTAGMSLHAMLHRDRFFYLSPDPRKVWDPDQKSIFFSYLNNGGHSIRRSEKFPFQFTIMRDPIDRYLSHFNWRNNIMGENWMFEEYLEHEEYKDFQFKKMKHYTNKNDVDSILRIFSFVGIFEDFEITLRILSDRLGLHPIPVRENQKSYACALKKRDLTEAQLERCRENNLVDYELYGVARDLFETTPVPSNTLEAYRTLSLHARAKQKSFNLLTRARR